MIRERVSAAHRVHCVLAWLIRLQRPAAQPYSQSALMPELLIPQGRACVYCLGRMRQGSFPGFSRFQVSLV